LRRLILAIFGALTLGLLGVPAIAEHGNADQASSNMLHVAGRPPVPARGESSTETHSDIAFWNNLAVAGTYQGFRLFDITNPENPIQLSNVRCRGPQCNCFAGRGQGQRRVAVS
jgi:hypothetical protein